MGEKCKICGGIIKGVVYICPTCNEPVCEGCTEDFLGEYRCVNCSAMLREEHA
jgi:hypothetical protein